MQNPEDDQSNWFLAPNAEGPAVITAIVGGGRWEVRDDATPGHVLQFDDGPHGIHKLFLKKGQRISLAFDSKREKVGLLSGYKIPE